MRRKKALAFRSIEYFCGFRKHLNCYLWKCNLQQKAKYTMPSFKQDPSAPTPCIPEEKLVYFQKLQKSPVADWVYILTWKNLESHSTDGSEYFYLVTCTWIEEHSLQYSKWVQALETCSQFARALVRLGKLSFNGQKTSSPLLHNSYCVQTTRAILFFLVEVL